MALDLKYCFSQQCDCTSALFNDNTGVYQYANYGGYGTPNVESSAITSATIAIIPPTYINPITFDFTIAANEITAATKTDEYGNVTDVLSLLNTTAFPFVDLEFNGELLFNAASDSLLMDGSWLLTYQISDGTDVYSLQAYNYFICSAKRCKDSTAISYAEGGVTREKAINIFFNYDMLLAGVGLNDNSFVDRQVQAMASLCNPCNC